MKYTEDQFSKLPKWAQQEIKSLEIKVDGLSKRLDEYKGDKETNTYIRDGLSKIPIPNNSCVEFKTGENQEHCVTVYVNRSGFVDINTDSRLGYTTVLMPRAGNSVFVSFVKM